MDGSGGRQAVGVAMIAGFKVRCFLHRLILTLIKNNDMDSLSLSLSLSLSHSLSLTHTHIHTHTHTHTCTPPPPHTHTHTHTHTGTHTHTLTLRHIYTYIHTQAHRRDLTRMRGRRATDRQNTKSVIVVDRRDESLKQFGMGAWED